MKRQQRVLWSKGMFLSAQQFQAQTAFQIDESQFRFGLARFGNWGISHLDLDEESVKNGIVKVIRGSGVFPDGLCFSFPDSDPPLQSLSLAGIVPPEAKEVDVFLAVPEHRVGAQNISNEGGPTLRFTAQDSTFVDEYDGLEEIIQVAQPNLRLFVGEKPTGMTTMRLARLERGQGDSFRYVDGFVPPCLTIEASRHLVDEVLPGLIQSLTYFSRKLASERSDQNESVADAMDETRARVLLVVNTSLPELQHLVAIRQVHPEEVYRFLLRLGGALCTFSKEFEPRSLAAYDHNDLGRCFGDLVKAIKQMLNSIVFPESNIVKIELREVEPWLWEGSVRNEELLKRASFFICFQSSRDIDDEELLQAIKVAGPNRMEDVDNNALKGARLRRTDPPQGRPRRTRARYFQITKLGEEWDDVVDSKLVQINLVLADAGRYEPEVELFAVLD